MSRLFISLPRAKGIHLLAVTLFAVAFASIANLQADTFEFRVTGNVGKLTQVGKVVLTRSTAVIGSSETLAKAALETGSFELLGESDYGGRVSLGVFDAEDNFIRSTQFILEPGAFEVEYIGGVIGLSVSGGRYNQVVIESWSEGEDYQAALESYAQVMDAKKDLSEADEGYQELLDEAWERFEVLRNIRREALRVIAESDGDALASLYAIEMGGLGGEAALKRLDQLEEPLVSHLVLSNLRSRIQRSDELVAASTAVQIDSQMRGFSAPDLDGQVHHLNQVLADNRFVLVEFWASWCGPCRIANPHLKEVHDAYQGAGFEIFAFSLDDNREDWELASEEDGIPWINTSDLMAYDSPIAGQFGVMAIPANFLLDKQGVVVAMSLQGEVLDDKLEEVMGSDLATR